jgi:hypothetical protein
MARVILALLIVLGLAAPALAQAPPSNIDRWDMGLLIDTLRTLGATGLHPGVADGRPTLAAVTRDGLNMTLEARGCDTPPPLTGPVCHAIEAVITFDLSHTPDRAAIADQLNHGFAMGKFTVERDGSLRASRYILLDDGLSPDNLRQQLIDFMEVGVLAREKIWPQAGR